MVEFILTIRLLLRDNSTMLSLQLDTELKMVKITGSSETLGELTGERKATSEWQIKAMGLVLMESFWIQPDQPQIEIIKLYFLVRFISLICFKIFRDEESKFSIYHP